MPFNRVNDQKTKLFWLQILNHQYEDSETPDDFLPPFVPGMLLFPIPSAGWLLGRVDIAFWAEFLYVAGSVVYVIDGLFIWSSIGWESHDDGMTPGGILNIVAALIFIVNAWACFMDWWLQLKQLSFLNIEIDEQKQAPMQITNVSTRASIYYFCNNFFFMGAAVVYLVQGIWWVNPATDVNNCYFTFCGTFWVNFWGSLLYLLSSSFSVLEYYDNVAKRKMQGLPPLKMFTWLNSEEFDWFGWGDWLYLAAGIAEIWQAFDASFVNNDDNVPSGMYLLSNVLFLVDSIAYMTAYILYIFEVRRAMRTGLLSPAQAQIVSAILLEQQEQQAAQAAQLNHHTTHTQSLAQDSTGRKSRFSTAVGAGGAAAGEAEAEADALLRLEHVNHTRQTFSVNAAGMINLADVKNRYKDTANNTRESRLSRMSDGYSPPAALASLAAAAAPPGAGKLSGGPVSRHLAESELTVTISALHQQSAGPNNSGGSISAMGIAKDLDH